MSEAFVSAAPAERVTPSSRKRTIAIAAVSALVLCLVGVASGLIIHSKAATIGHLRRQLAGERLANADLQKKVARARKDEASTKVALSTATTQLAKAKRDAAKAKRQAANEFVNGYSSGYSSGSSTSNSYYNAGYNDGYKDGYNYGLCIDPSDGSYVC